MMSTTQKGIDNIKALAHVLLISLTYLGFSSQYSYNEVLVCCFGGGVVFVTLSYIRLSFLHSS